jgi:hypothetical protein
MPRPNAVEVAFLMNKHDWVPIDGAVVKDISSRTLSIQTDSSLRFTFVPDQIEQ